MTDWIPTETSTHQDHVIAHVVGATVEAHFIWDETAYLLLDIGFIWNIYLDGEMGLVPQTQAIAELNMEQEAKNALRADLDSVSTGLVDAAFHTIGVPSVNTPIQSVDFEASGNSRRLLLNCEEGGLVVETSLETGEVMILEI